MRIAFGLRHHQILIKPFRPLNRRGSLMVILAFQFSITILKKVQNLAPLVHVRAMQDI